MVQHNGMMNRSSKKKKTKKNEYNYKWGHCSAWHKKNGLGGLADCDEPTIHAGRK